MSALEVVQALYRAFAVRDRETILRLMHEDIEWVQNEGFPNGCRHVGAVHVLDDVLSQFRREWSEFRAEVTEWIAEGENVVALGVYRGLYIATGHALEAAFAHVYTVRNSRVVRFRQFTDTALFLRARASGS